MEAQSSPNMSIYGKSPRKSNILNPIRKASDSNQLSVPLASAKTLRRAASSQQVTLTKQEVDLQRAPVSINLIPVEKLVDI